MKNKKFLFYFFVTFVLIGFGRYFFLYLCRDSTFLIDRPAVESAQIDQSLYEDKDINFKKAGLIHLSDSAIKTHPKKYFLTNRKPTALLEDIPKNLIANSLLQSTRWKIWSQVKAIKNENLKPSDDVLSEVSHMSVIRDNSYSADLTHFNSKELVVIYNERLKKVGLISGYIKVQTQYKEKLGRDLPEVHAQVNEAFENIKTYFVTGQDNVFNLEEIYFFLKDKNYIDNIEIDIIDRAYERN